MPSFYDLLKYAATGIASPDMTAYDKMRALAMAGGGAIKTLTGVPPLSFRANGKPLISWSMLGNGQQNGTPTPDAPIMPTFCGERTVNLFYGVYPNIGTTAQYKPIFVGDGEFTLSTTCIRTTANTANLFFLAGNVSSGISTNDNGVWNGNDRTVTAVNGYVTIAYRRYSAGDTADPLAADTMLNLGSTALPYEPYGYKLPITCAGQTTPIYLGQVSTVRRVKKLVLDGTEDWQKHITIANWFYCDRLIDNNAIVSDGTNGISSHFIVSDYALAANLSDGRMTYGHPGGASFSRLIIKYSAYSETGNFKQWLSDQYSAGTPVTVWYVLATPETSIVNEPLCKIGDYADELHSADAGVSIPTAKGANTLTVDTDLQPSSMTITYR